MFADDVDIGVNGMVTYDLVPTERNVTVDPQSVSFFLKPFCYWLKTGKYFVCLFVKLTILCWKNINSGEAGG